MRQLRDAETGLDGHQQEGVVTPADPLGTIGCRDQGLGFRFSEEGDDRSVTALARYGQHALDDLGMLGMTERGEAEEGMQRSQTGVASPHAITAIVLQMFKKGSDDRRTEIFDTQA